MGWPPGEGPLGAALSSSSKHEEHGPETKCCQHQLWKRLKEKQAHPEEKTVEDSSGPWGNCLLQLGALGKGRVLFCFVFQNDLFYELSISFSFCLNLFHVRAPSFFFPLFLKLQFEAPVLCVVL